MTTMRNPDGRVSRRDALRMGVGAAVLGGGALAGCAGGAGASSQTPALTAQSGAIEILLNANVQGVSWNKTVQGLYQTYIDQNFNENSKYRGIHATVTATSGQGNAPQQITASIAGQGYPDILEGCCTDFPDYFSGGWLIPLDGYIKRDNISTSIWSKRHMDALNILGQQLAVPAYDGTVAIVYRQDMLDTLGLQYPDQSWTYQDALRIWESCTAVDPNTHKQRSGVSVYFHTDDWQKLHFWLQGWGAQETDPTLTSCLAASAQGIACLQYIQDAAKNKVMIPRGDVTPVANGTAVFSMCGVWTLFSQAQELGTKYKWNTLPVPAWPNGRSTYNNIDFYGINKASKNPDAAWEVLKWITVAPGLLSLWDQWQTTVKSVAPPLRDKNIQWYQDALQNNYSWPAVFFKYNQPQIIQIIDNWMNQIWSLQVSPQAGLQQMAQQINAIEQLGPALAAAQQSAAKEFPTQGADQAIVPTGI
jgi:ABC-type glycerol-3-phosphate transport system substrate-binding protein